MGNFIARLALAVVAGAGMIAGSATSAWSQSADGNSTHRTESGAAATSTPQAALRREKPGKLSPGDLFPDFSGKTVDGRQVRLGDYRGKVVLVDFWATWCGPCRVELPSLLAAYARFRDKGFEVVGVSLDRSAEALAGWQADPATVLPWPSIFDGQAWQSSLAQRCGINAIPAAFLLDREGRILAVDVRGDEISRSVARADRPKGFPAPLPDLVESWQKADATRREQLGQTIIAAAANDQENANTALWALIGRPDPEPAAAELTWKALQPSTTSTVHAFLDTLAWAAYHTGRTQEAAELQRRVVQIVNDINYASSQWQQLWARLGLYELAAGNREKAKTIADLLTAASAGQPRSSRLLHNRTEDTSIYLEMLKATLGDPAPAALQAQAGVSESKQ